jgi:hypothetical protein
MASVHLGRPEATEFGGDFAKYVTLVPEAQILDQLATQRDEVLQLLRPLNEEAANTIHPPYTWTIKDVVGHLTDCERIFAYRALRAARGDTTPLPGFDENLYADCAHFSTFPQHSVLSGFEHLRQATINLFTNLDEEAWLRQVVATGTSISVRAWAYVIVGHTRHHLRILYKRLGK